MFVQQLELTVFDAPVRLTFKAHKHRLVLSKHVLSKIQGEEYVKKKLFLQFCIQDRPMSTALNIHIEIQIIGLKGREHSLNHVQSRARLNKMGIKKKKLIRE